MEIMRKLDTRYSIVDLMIISLVLLFMFILSKVIGWEPIIIGLFIISLSIVFFMLLWKYAIRLLIKKAIKNWINETEVSIDDQLGNRFEDPDFWFIILLVVLLLGIIPSLILIFFGLGSIFIAGISIIIISVIGAVVSIEIPWPSRLTQRNLGFKIKNR